MSKVVVTLVTVATVFVVVDVTVGVVAWRLQAELMTVGGYLVKAAGVEMPRFWFTVTVAVTVAVV